MIFTSFSIKISQFVHNTFQIKYIDTLSYNLYITNTYSSTILKYPSFAMMTKESEVVLRYTHAFEDKQ